MQQFTTKKNYRLVRGLLFFSRVRKKINLPSPVPVMYLYLLRIENLSARLKIKRTRTVIEINILRRKNHVYHRKQTSKKFETLLKYEKN